MTDISIHGEVKLGQETNEGHFDSKWKCKTCQATGHAKGKTEELAMDNGSAELAVHSRDNCL